MRYSIFLFLSVTFFGYSQEEIGKGKVITKVPELQAIHVINKTQNIGTITDQFGNFEIKAAIGDVMIFSSVQYYSKKHRILKEDLYNPVEIKLETKVNELDEVLLSQYSLTGKIENDLQKISTYTDNLPFWNAAELKKMGVGTFNDAQSPVENLALKSGADQVLKSSIDINALAKAITAVFTKQKGPVLKKEETNFLSEEVVIELLDIPETEYYNFIDFVNEQSDVAIVMNSKDELQILEYFIYQSEVFRKKYGIKN